jgi:hypothetical protein
MVAWTVELGIVVNLHSAVFVDSDMRQFMRVLSDSERAFELQQGHPGGGEGECSASFAVWKWDIGEDTSTR